MVFAAEAGREKICGSGRCSVWLGRIPCWNGNGLISTAWRVRGKRGEKAARELFEGLWGVAGAALGLPEVRV